MTATMESVQWQQAPRIVDAGEWPPEDLERVESCPVCGSKDRKLLYDGLTDRVFHCAPGEWTLYTCGGCGSAYLDPRPTRASIGRAYGEYFTHAAHQALPVASLSKLRLLRRALANGYRNWRFGASDEPASALGVPITWVLPGVRNAFLNAYRHAPKPHQGARLLDVGAGNGDYLALVRSAGWAVQGVEPDPAAAAVCRKRGLNVVEGSIGDLHEGPARFDFITISHVIEHVHDPRSVLQSVFDLLKPGGCLYIDTPNCDAYGRYRFGRNWRGLEPPRHLVLFNWASLKALIRDIGFRTPTPKTRSCVYENIAAWSRALAQGREWSTGKPTLTDRAVGRWLDVKQHFSNTHSEYVTLIAQKPEGVR